MTIGYSGTTHHLVRRISSLLIKMSLIGRFSNHQLARQRRFIYLQRHRLKQFTIGRNLFASIKDNDIPYHNFLAGNLANLSVTYHRNGNLFAHRIQQVELLISIIFKVKADACSQKYSKENTDSLSIFIFEYRDS